MHIPDNYLSPQTDAVMAVAMVPVWVHCIKKVRATLDREHMAFLGICAAFSFLLMMFNVPLPGGTRGRICHQRCPAAARKSTKVRAPPPREPTPQPPGREKMGRRMPLERPVMGCASNQMRFGAGKSPAETIIRDLPGLYNG